MPPHCNYITTHNKNRTFGEQTRTSNKKSHPLAVENEQDMSTYIKIVNPTSLENLKTVCKR